MHSGIGIRRRKLPPRSLRVMLASGQLLYVERVEELPGTNKDRHDRRPRSFWQPTSGPGAGMCFLSIEQALATFKNLGRPVYVDQAECGRLKLQPRRDLLEYLRTLRQKARDVGAATSEVAS